MNYKKLTVLYLLLAFSITWGIALLVIILPAEFVAHYFGKINVSHPLFFLAVYAPSISAIIIVARFYGLRKLGIFLEKIVNWKIGYKPYVLALFLVLGTYFVIRFFQIKSGIPVPTFAYKWYMVLPTALLYLFIDAGPIGEELGWRGFLLPLLQKKFSSLWSSLILGFIWATWHLPAFFISNTHQHKRSIVIFYFALVSFNMLIVQIYNLSNGSVLITIILHWFLDLNTYMSITGPSLIATAIIFLASALAIKMIYRPKEVCSIFPGENEGLLTK